MKKKRILKTFLTLILIILQVISLSLVSYVLYLYDGVETFYRILGIIILIYLFFLFSYLLIRGIKKKGLTSFLVPALFTIIILIIEITIFYYLNKIYQTINSYSDNENMYYTSLVTYDSSLDKNLVDKKVGLINDEGDIEGYILALDIIDDLKLKENNVIKYYDSTMELLYGLKNNEIDAAIFSSNYVEMFSTLDGFEDIETETKVLYSIEKEYINEEESNEEETSSSLTEPFTMLLIGVDSSKDGVTSGYNADVLLLVSFNPKTLRATLTSIPRDMYLQTACSGSKYRRINTTTWGSSSSCAVNTVENLFDVDIDYYAKVNFKGIVELVDAVGGIDVDVDYSICEQNSSRKWGNNTVYVEKGKQHLNGEQALAFARNRHKPNDGSKVGTAMAKYCPTYTEGTRNDYTRGKNQMKVILGIVKSATKLTDPNQAIDILETISSNFQTNIKSKDVLSLYNLGKSIVINDSSNLINVQRMQLSGKNVWGTVYDTSSKSYPAVTLPYKESINAIKEVINENLGKSKTTMIKSMSFDLNNLYKDTVLGSGKYSNTGITTLKDLSNMDVSSIKSYMSSINKGIKFVDIDTNEELNINDYSSYTFYKQSEHKDTIINQFNTVTVYVKKISY